MELFDGYSKEEFELIIKGKVYHELGHLFGYLLSYGEDNNSLGHVEKINIGFELSSVVPSHSLYHVIDLNNKNELEILKYNLMNKKRTIAWFIEVIAGCTFESICKNKELYNCFNDRQGNGSIDYMNINKIKDKFAYGVTMYDFNTLGLEFKTICVKHNIIPLVHSIANELFDNVIANNNKQHSVTGKELTKLEYKLNKIISNEMRTDYNDLIEKWLIYFSTPNDIPIFIPYQVFPS